MTEKDVSIFDWINPKTERADEEVYEERIKTCSSCEHLVRPTFQCSKCGCFMKLKAALNAAKCPIEKWVR